MKTTKDFLEDVARLSARERAAAIAHYVYMKTAERVGWDKRMPVAWDQLPSDAKEFNVASIETWSRERELLDAWSSALNQIERDA